MLEIIFLIIDMISINKINNYYKQARHHKIFEMVRNRIVDLGHSPGMMLVGKDRYQ